MNYVVTVTNVRNETYGQMTEKHINGGTDRHNNDLFMFRQRVGKILNKLKKRG